MSPQFQSSTVHLISWAKRLINDPTTKKTTQVYCGFKHIADSASKTTCNDQAAECLATAQCGYIAQHGPHVHVALVIPESLGKSSFLSPLLVKIHSIENVNLPSLRANLKFIQKEMVNEPQFFQKKLCGFILQFASIHFFLCWLHPPNRRVTTPAPGLDADIRGEVFLTSDVFSRCFNGLQTGKSPLLIGK